MAQAHRWDTVNTRPNPYAYIRYMPDMRMGGGYSKGSLFKGEAPSRTPFSANTGAGPANWERPASIGAIDFAGKPFGNPFGTRRDTGADTAPIQTLTAPTLGQGAQPQALPVASTPGSSASNMYAYAHARGDRQLPAGGAPSASRGTQRYLTAATGALPSGASRTSLPALPGPGSMLALPAGRPQLGPGPMLALPAGSPQPGSRNARRTNFSLGG